MRLNNEEEEENDPVELLAQVIEENVEKILDRSNKEVDIWCEGQLDNLLSLTEQIGDDILRAKMETYINIGFGAVSESILILKRKNEILWNENNLGKHYQTPDLN
tara:strand:- start:10779 stop:11093 length:315 start_codon:yes stop_codon:yes gene_type:complete